MDEIATKDSWQNTPIDSPERIEINLLFSEDELLKLKKGLIPYEMEDKWFIYYEEDWLYFHRSWTGYCLYKAMVTREQEGYSIKEFWAERNESIYKNQDNNIDKEILCFLIARGLLDIDVRQLYLDKHSSSEADILKNWSLFGRLLFENNDE